LKSITIDKFSNLDPAIIKKIESIENEKIAKILKKQAVFSNPKNSHLNLTSKQWKKLNLYLKQIASLKKMKSKRLELIIQKIIKSFNKLENELKKPNKSIYLQRLNQTIMEFEGEKDTLKSLISLFYRLKDNNYIDQEAKKVTLCTMHAAKGLEFKYVFLIGFEKGYIPYLKKEADPEEEKRLFYVALTRAKNNVYLIRAKNRLKNRKAKKSDFLEVIASPFLKKIIDPKLEKIKKKLRRQEIKKQQTSLF
ncbi:MAG: hypothetical protein GF347_05470, partial [Candidatus Moranbacteria bacterium]|nr:hypothetical protein [Candidatus Moranbacteria bacterium]